MSPGLALRSQFGKHLLLVRVRTYLQQGRHVPTRPTPVRGK